MSLQWHTVRRGFLVVLLVAHEVLFVFVAAGYLQRGTTNNQLSTTLSRRSPTTEYTNAVNAEIDCRDGYRDRQTAHMADFTLHVDGVLLLDRAAPDAAQGLAVLRGELARDAQLAQLDAAHLLAIDSLCPAPTPPKFSGDGQLVSDAQVPALQPVGPDPAPEGQTDSG